MHSLFGFHIYVTAALATPSETAVSIWKHRVFRLTLQRTPVAKQDENTNLLWRHPKPIHHAVIHKKKKN